MTVHNLHGQSSDKMQQKRDQTCSSNANEEDLSPEPKKARLLEGNTSSSSPCGVVPNGPEERNSFTRWLIDDCNEDVTSKIPTSLGGGNDKSTKKKIGQNLDQLRRLLDGHGLRTTKISSPREAVSIYIESCQMGTTDTDDDDSVRDGKEFLLITFGLHPQQERIANEYERFTKNSYCLLLFCQKLRREYWDTHRGSSSTAVDAEDDLKRLLSQIDATLALTKDFRQKKDMPSRVVEEQINKLIELATNVKEKRSYRQEEWRKEFHRICVSNSTISNAYIFLLQSSHDMCIKDIFLKFNKHQPKYDRITIYLYDPAIDYGRRPDFFLILPGLRTVITRGHEQLVKEMIESFWTFVIRKGYFATAKLQGVLESTLSSFFMAGITSGDDSNLPLPLKANFVPRFPFAIYLHGRAGAGMFFGSFMLVFPNHRELRLLIFHSHHFVFAGKSSLAKVIPQALQSTLEKYVDPECIARFVKQNLNKTIKTLDLEFELRPNNNDMSIMSIIQGRRMAMRQSKPGLVVLNLEEMPMNSSESNPNQYSVAKLISQRFGGRKGKYQDQQSNAAGSKTAPRNSDKRSIGRDCSLVSIFTSNYALAEDSKLALEQLPLYQSLLTIEMTAITGSDRREFAKAYLRQCLLDSSGLKGVEISTEDISLEISAGNGDTRPLVRQLRMYAYYLGKSLKSKMARNVGLLEVKGIQIAQSETNCVLTVKSQIGGDPIEQTEQHLKLGRLGNWFPTGTFAFDTRIKSAMKMLTNLLEDEQAVELAVILEFWFSTTLAPAVVLSRDISFIKCLMSAIKSMGDNIHSIRNVDASSYKMIRSLYDPREMPNLRDDILKFGSGALVATELKCPTTDSQLCIREMIEDSPSMTAFSSAKSALYKSGLLFAIHVEGDITPEILSRVSIII